MIVAFLTSAFAQSTASPLPEVVHDFTPVMRGREPAKRVTNIHWNEQTNHLQFDLIFHSVLDAARLAQFEFREAGFARDGSRSVGVLTSFEVLWTSSVDGKSHVGHVTLHVPDSGQDLRSWSFKPQDSEDKMVGDPYHKFTFLPDGPLPDPSTLPYNLSLYTIPQHEEAALKLSDRTLPEHQSTWELTGPVKPLSEEQLEIDGEKQIYREELRRLQSIQDSVSQEQP